MNSQEEVRALPEGALVRDAHGQVWYVKHTRNEVWLCPFSDEYSVPIESKMVLWPIEDTGIRSTGGA